MVDFNKKIINSNKFRQPALQFLATGHYCQYPEGTSEYFKYWDEEQDRCINGYTADDGDFISGYNYFYLNYCPISRIVNHITTDKDGNTVVKRINEVSFPDFWDYDYYYFNAVQEAETVGKHLCLLKSRRKGFSYKGGSMACRNFYLIPNSKTFIYASNKQYLTDDGILTKAWDYMDFIDKNTAWGKKRSVNTQMRRRAGFYTKDDYGNVIEMGYKSEIIGVTLKDNPDVVRGKKANLIMFEEGGSFSELGAAWQIARPSVEVDGIAFGTMIVWGTGGDEGSAFETMKDMFYNPDGYNCLGFDNIWDETATTNKCGFFVPQYTNLDIRDKDGKRIYMDDDGNTFKKKSLEHILAERQVVITNATSNAAVDRYVAERPITPAEAVLEFNGNIFPKKELQEQLSLLRTNKKLQNHKQVGDLIQQPDGTIKWVIKKTGDITHYPLRTKRDEVTGALVGDDPTGSIVIWEHPNKDASAGLYIAGIDSYDYDESSTTSLGSCFIYKRIQSIEQYSDIIVAEYVAKPGTRDDYSRNVELLLGLYNNPRRSLMFERNRGEKIEEYFKKVGKDYLLAFQPSKYVDGKVKMQQVLKYGHDVGNQHDKLELLNQFAEWLLEKTTFNGETKMNIQRICSVALLDEILNYDFKADKDKDANYDRISAMLGCIVARKEGFNQLKDNTVVKKFNLDFFAKDPKLKQFKVI